MKEVVRRINLKDIKENKTDILLNTEWLVTNGLGGYASGTISGVSTRRYHGFLIAALPSPLGRTVMFNHLSELFRFKDGSSFLIGSEEKNKNELSIPSSIHLTEFRLEYGLPVWRYEIGGYVIEKQILMPYSQNTVIINYRFISGEDVVKLRLKPSLHFRPHEAPVNIKTNAQYVLNIVNNKFEISDHTENPPLRMFIYGERSALTVEGGEQRDVFYRSEFERGYESEGFYWNPGYFKADLYAGRDVSLVVSTEPWEKLFALKPKEAFAIEMDRRQRLIIDAGLNTDSKFSSELILASDQFLFTPVGRLEHAARFEAAGGRLKSVIAGYHWFTDWGRDTMISLEGLTLVTGRYQEAYWILRSFSSYVKDGLIPNLFPEGRNSGLYHTADATMWFFQALAKYEEYTNDKSLVSYIYPTLKEIILQHMKGTRFGIGMDTKDSLLKQGEEGYQLTWMDAKVDDWVVTPRRGKVVEINSLWYNALCLMKNWALENNDESSSKLYEETAKQVRSCFNERFWYEKEGYLYDVIDGESGDDHAIRPNQIFSISLKHPVLDRDKWESVVNVVRLKLLTPVGLRSLSKNHPDYKEKYFGDLRTRDAAYHQGTVWGWLIGPFIDAWLKVYPDKTEEARQFLSGFELHLNESCVGSISEIFDAESPYTPRGCIAQAWSVAEVLRCSIRLGC